MAARLPCDLSAFNRKNEMKRTNSAENKTLAFDAFGELVIVHGRIGGHGRPKNWIAAGSKSSEPTAAQSGFVVDVIAGLSAREKTLPPKYFYDAAGSELFEAIGRTPEYYPPRVETALLQQFALEIT